SPSDPPLRRRPSPSSAVQEIKRTPGALAAGGSQSASSADGGPPSERQTETGLQAGIVVVAAVGVLLRRYLLEAQSQVEIVSQRIRIVHGRDGVLGVHFLLTVGAAADDLLVLRVHRATEEGALDAD